MSDKPEVVGNYKPLIYLTANDNVDDLEKLFNSKTLQQEIKLFTEDISKENPSSSKKIYKNLGKIGILFSTLGFGTAGAAFSVISSPIAIPALSMAIFAGMFANDLGEIFANDLQDVMTKLSSISGKNTNLPGNNYINLLEQNFQVLPYSSALGTLIFPPGHPMPNKLYRQHPLPDKKHYYMPNDYYYKILLEEKEVELIKILCDLGANKIEMYEEENTLNKIAFEAEANMTSVVETEAKVSK